MQQFPKDTIKSLSSDRENASNNQKKPAIKEKYLRLGSFLSFVIPHSSFSQIGISLSPTSFYYFETGAVIQGILYTSQRHHKPEKLDRF